MIRDQLADAEYFSNLLIEEEEYLAEDLANIDSRIQSMGAKARSAAFNIAKTQILCASIAYSRGDTIEMVRDRINTAFSNLKFLHELYDRFPSQMRKSMNSYRNSLLLLSHAVLYRPDTSSKLRVIRDVEFFEPEDPLLAAMLAYVKGEELDVQANTIALAFPESFAELWQAVQLEEAGSAPLKRYVEGWYNHNENPEYGAGLGIGSHEKMIRYVGYWCWEAAAVAVMMGIDDSTFRDHQHYPKDLADWARRR